MFIVDPNPTFTHTVKVKVPVDGGFEDQSFKATYQLIPADEVADYDLSTGAGTAAFALRAVVSMSDLVDKDRQPVAYNDRVRDQLLQQSYVRKAVAHTYLAAINEAQSGN